MFCKKLQVKGGKCTENLSFIQVVMAKPLCIMYWTEVGIRIYHEL